MFVRYRSDYANQVQQLLVSVSRHLYVASDGHVRYQKKPFAVALDSMKRSAKDHVIHYLIRDHFSGHFYAELGRSGDAIDPKAFLLRAWAVKREHSFCGLPELLTVPATVSRWWPELNEFVSGWNVEVLEPTSGFQAGVRDLQTWEQQIRFDVGLDVRPFAATQQLALIRSFLLSTDEINGESKLARWKSGLKGPLKIPGIEPS